MSKVTSKYQVSIPKVLADQYGIQPGDSLFWEAAGEALMVNLAQAKSQQSILTKEQRLASFKKAVERLKIYGASVPAAPGVERGWVREDLYKEREDRMLARIEDSLKSKT